MLRWNFSGCGSLLLKLESKSDRKVKPCALAKFEETARLSDPVPVTLSEPNVLLLDQAQWRINEGTWKPVEEILRLDNWVRRELGLPDRIGEIPQPWTDKEAFPTLAQVELRFEIKSEIAVQAPLLALENAASVKISLNGEKIFGQITGWWVDEDIQTVALPRLEAGVHELILSFSFDRKTDIENAYLLGDFGVQVSGRHAGLIAPMRQLAFGDWTRQGLPFYAGNVTYHCQIKAITGPCRIQVPQFKNPLLAIALDRKPLGHVAFPPFEIDLGSLVGRVHSLDLIAYGNRYNTFGALHNSDPFLIWKGPHAYRSEGAGWSYEYQLKPMGILTAPLIKKCVDSGH